AGVGHLLDAGAGGGADDVACLLEAGRDDVALGVARPHEEARGGVVDAPAAGDGARRRLGVADVAVHDLDVEAGECRRVGAGADHGAHAFAAREEQPAEVVADVAVGAGDERGLHGPASTSIDSPSPGVQLISSLLSRPLRGRLLGAPASRCGGRLPRALAPRMTPRAARESPRSRQPVAGLSGGSELHPRTLCRIAACRTGRCRSSFRRPGAWSLLCRKWLETTLSIGAPPGLSATAGVQPTSGVPRRSGFGRRAWRILLALALASVLGPAAASAVVCGDGVLDLLEGGHLGAGNGASDSCCTSSCTFR